MSNEQENKPALFQDPVGGMVLSGTSETAAMARATQEVQAALVIAKKFPRDEVKAIQKITVACNRLGLAQFAEYEYNRGGTRITGPTIDLLVAIANRWGNVVYGWEEVERAEGQSKVRCYAWDMENNGRAERTFHVRHWRDTQGGGHALKDERDIYEMIANQASRRVRSCLEQVIDQDVIALAVSTCRDTMRKGEKTPLRDRAVQVVLAFAEMGVTQGMIERRLGNKVEAISENQLAGLRRVYKSIRDGEGQREDFFKSDPLDPNLPGGPQQPETTVVQSAKSAAAPSDSTPASAAKSKKPLPPAQTPLAKLRELARKDNVKEGELLSFLASNNSTDGSVDTLETLVMQFPSVVDMCVENWTELSARIQGA